MATEITERAVDQAAAELRPVHGGIREDYFGLLYLERRHNLAREQALDCIALGGNDYGIDGFHFDEARRNLYLYQFKFSPNASQFVSSLRRLIEDGLQRVFLAPNQDAAKNPILVKLRNCLIENRNLIDQVFVRFVFTGALEDVERSVALQRLREDLRDRRHLLAAFFGDRKTEFLVDFKSTKPGEDGETHAPPPPLVFTVPIESPIVIEGPNGQRMHVGLVPLTALCQMQEGLGAEFLHRNIRFGLGHGGAVNRSIDRTFQAIGIERTEDPSAFPFNHNGITLYAEKVELEERGGGPTHLVTAPRLLNGAQTVTTAKAFLQRQKDNPKLANGGREAFDSIRLLCRIVTSPDHAFVTRVTVNNNRQNPVEPWNLRANDLVQLELQDMFRTELGIYYERQENAFENLTAIDFEEGGIREDSKAIELLKLAQTFLVTDGHISRLADMRAVFEEDRLYDQVFRQARLRANPRHVLLCYKAQGKLRAMVKAIEARSQDRYWYASRARSLIWALVCQALLNDGKLEVTAEKYGTSLVVQADYTEMVLGLANTRISYLLRELLADAEYKSRVAEDNLSFLRTDRAFEKCMRAAHAKWRWVHRKLS